MIHKTTRSILSVLLAALLLVTSTPLTPAFAGEGAVSLQSESGEGRVLEQVNGEYQIGSAEDLREFAKLVNNKGETDADAVLTADIDLSEICSEEKGVSWTPIGSDSHPYTGTFNGNGHTISGLYLNNSTADDQGLFGYVDSEGTVQNLTVSGSVSGKNHVGGVVGDNRGSVENCHNTGTVTGTGDYVGGVVGYNFASVENCYNTGSVTSSVGSVGGVVGDNRGTVENCYNTGSVTSSGSPVGGVVGYNDSGGSVTNCYNTGTVTGTDDYVGGVGGVVGWNISSGNVTNCYNTGAVSGGEYVGGVVGYNRGTVTGCYFLKQGELQGIGDGVTDGQTANSVTTLDALCDALVSDTTTWSISPFYEYPVLKANPEGGLGTAAHPYEIKTAAQLKTFRDIVNSENGQQQNKAAHAVLMENINLNNEQWTPIGTSSNEYSGNFNGNGHTISGLYIYNSTAGFQGLFGYVSGSGKIENLSVSGSVSGNSSVGGVVGLNGGSVEDCDFTGSVSGSYVGGVVGWNASGTVKNCYNTGEVSGSEFVGGVVGDNGGSVTNSYNTGTVTGPVSASGNNSVCVGGVVGSNSFGATVTGTVTGTVTNCYNTGTVTGPDSVNGETTVNVGGVVGSNSFGATVTNCYNTGSVSGPDSGTSNYVGGVVGYNDGSSTVENCYYQTGKGATVGIGGTTGDNSKAEGKTDAQFASGEVAHLLEQNVADSEKPVWGQSNLTATTSLPTLVALNPGAAQPVYKVTFKYGYEGAPEEKISYSNGSVEFPAFERTGYTFAGWTPTGTTISQDTTFTAQWTANTYTVKLNLNGGTIVEGNLTSYTYGIGATLPTTVTREGYTFEGWYEKEDLTGNPVIEISATDTGEKEYWAKWEEVENPEPTPTPTPTPDPTPSGPSTGDSTGWDDILDELENAEKGEQITIDMGDETKVPAEIFESLAGKDVDVTFDLGDIQWSASGADIPTDTDFTDLDLGASLGTSGIPVNVINTITGEVGTVQITLAHDGDFGFTMTLTAPLGKENAGYWANLYHYDESAEALNFEAAAEIDADGNAALPLSHASQYAIVIDTHSHAAVDVSDLFLDIAPDAWYKDAVQYAYAGGLMTGVSATEFAPEQTTTRAMIVSILARLEGVESAQAAGFADVNDNDWYATAVNWAANVGVVNGYEDNTFKPNTAITREQLAAILMNYAAYKGEDVSNRADLANYTDQPSTWAEEAISWSVAEGLLTGVTADTLQPQGAATRAQVAAILQRFLSE